MGFEQGESHSDNWGVSEEAFAMMGEILVLPVEIPFLLVGEALEGFEE